MTAYRTDEAFALELDDRDPLRGFRGRFHIPPAPGGGESIYFCGNSLGLQPQTTASYLNEELEDWKRLGVEAHLHGRHPWLPYHEFLTEKMARVVGAKLAEVVCMNSLTANLHLMMVSFYRPTKKRHKILIEDGAFPSDIYAVKSQIKFHGFNPAKSLLTLKAKKGTDEIKTEDILEVLKKEGSSIALVMMSGVNYYTGQLFDMKRITEAAHKKGCMVGFDLAHAAGNTELKLHDWKVDFAAWCTYKYLNSGPGSVAGCFVHEKHVKNAKLPRFEGWWGHDKATRFKMPSAFKPMKTAEAWQLSNPPILSMAAIRASLDIFDEAGMDKLVKKSREMSAYLFFLLRRKIGGKAAVITPAAPEARGCQVSLRVGKKGKPIYDVLTRKGVICDWREPDVIRVAPVPLYNSFTDIWRFVHLLEEAMNNA